jgi:hypothetical protein
MEYWNIGKSEHHSIPVISITRPSTLCIGGTHGKTKNDYEKPREETSASSLVSETA